MEFCAGLMTACHVKYFRNSVLLVQTRSTMVKQLQHSLAVTPAATAHSLCAVHNWLEGVTLAINTQIDTCGDSALSLAVECTKLVQNLISV